MLSNECEYCSSCCLCVPRFQGFDRDVVILRKKPMDSPFDWWVLGCVWPFSITYNSIRHCIYWTLIQYSMCMHLGVCVCCVCVCVFSFVGKGMIPLPPEVVFQHVRNPTLRYSYDNMLKVRNVCRGV